MKFKNHIIWITGASSGIGFHLAKAFAKEGATVAASARRMELLEKLVQEIQQEGGKAQAFFCDVLEEQSIEKCLHEIIEAFGKLDVCIANAGGGVMGKIEKLSGEEWDRQLRLNVTGLALTAKYALPELRKTKGRLALIGSVAAFVPNPNLGAYGASKAAVHNIGETLQSELLGSGVSCTTIHPGFVDSNITRIDNEGNFHPEAKDPRPANLMWPTDQAAKAMVKAILNRKKMVVITGHGKVMYAISRLIPGVLRKMMAKMNG
ncbi:MAG: SDR family NAD(P)-dependent oxidoreductase [Mongoliibacter sp.]|uniref:SDR family NAD(P)-dependent oxidoreductase n=1 Tax=Mongoliibacter sp. TaxID=2022438 RepID=UPI0012EEE338|nr:SDR family NAD(P)-dependent oxidoreductase [Mongoliibacter sp.]TVP48113.1 MAG: SDR family NAD(P)-dependent oxidoreductase [Mongoliibacter sp.]